MRKSSEALFLYFASCIKEGCDAWLANLEVKSLPFFSSHFILLAVDRGDNLSPRQLEKACELPNRSDQPAGRFLIFFFFARCLGCPSCQAEMLIVVHLLPKPKTGSPTEMLILPLRTCSGERDSPQQWRSGQTRWPRGWCVRGLSLGVEEFLLTCTALHPVATGLAWPNPGPPTVRIERFSFTAHRPNCTFGKKI